MTKLEIRCPSCAKRGNIEVSEEEVKNTTRGLYAVNVTEGIICTHSFVAYVDKNFIVRDSYMADFQIELPQYIQEQEVELKLPIPTESVDVNLIKLNLTASLITHIIKAILYNKKVVIISDQDYMYDNITNFFNHITKNSFNSHISIMATVGYNSDLLKEYLVFEGKKILIDNGNIINPRRLKVERTIVQKFLDEYDASSSLLILKNELQKAYKLSETILEYVNNSKKKEKFYSKKIIDTLEKKYNLKINMPYLNFLLNIVENYFGVKVPMSSNFSNFLGTL